MSDNTKDNVEKLDVESLIVDLIACGLGATIILFFIFSLKIMQNTPDKKADSYAGKTADASGDGYNALIGDGNPGKPNRMGSIRVVEISDLNMAAIARLKQLWLSDSYGFWFPLVSDWKQTKKDSLLESIDKQVCVKPSSISFILSANGMRQVDFKIPDKSGIDISGQAVKPKLKVYFIEGSNVFKNGALKNQFNGTLIWPDPGGKELDNLNHLQITLLVGMAKQSSIKRLVKMSN